MTSQSTSPQPPVDPWITRWLSAARFGPYLTAANSDPRLALELYEWNAEMSSAVLHDLAHIEVAIRNAYNAALEQHTQFGAHWTLCSMQVFAPILRTKKRWDGKAQKRVPYKVDVNVKPRESLDRAVRSAGGAQAPPGKVIAELMFGFWRYLSSSAHEVALWRPYLHHAFQPGTSRVDIDNRIGDLHRLRNRVAHHEPLLAVNLSQRHTQLLELAGAIDPSVASHIASTSRVLSLIAAKPPRFAPLAPPDGSQRADRTPPRRNVICIRMRRALNREK